MMQEQKLPKSLIVKFKLPRGFSFEELSSASSSTITVQSGAMEPAQIEMASSSTAQPAVKKRGVPSMHAPQMIVKVKVSVKHSTITPAKLFAIHESFLCHYSLHFAKHFKDSNVDTYSVRLSSDEVKCFSSLVDWPYYQRIEDEDGAPLCTRDLILLWKLACDFEIASLENTVIDRIHGRFVFDDWTKT
ncbi:hypothetical protein DL98DRAFT_590024 [Cadophora sp. DSE1049]|nr:hypothetical protein DL98DRAFT_590024 [Cadophora sp. DSE1049]